MVNVPKGFVMGEHAVDAMTYMTAKRVGVLRVAFGPGTAQARSAAWTATSFGVKVRAKLWPIPSGAPTIVSGITMLVRPNVRLSRDTKTCMGVVLI